MSDAADRPDASDAPPEAAEAPSHTDVDLAYAGPSTLVAGQDHATLALACHSLGRDQEARQWLQQAKSWLKETNRTAAGWKFGFAATDYFGDWLCAQVLLHEAERLLADGQSP